MSSSDRRRRPSPLFEGAALALAAAALFGATTPWLKRAGAGVGAFSTAALLYTGAAAFAGATRLVRRPGSRNEPPLRWAHAPRLVVVAALGAFVAPSLLAWGLARSSGASASLLLNLEAAFTIGLAALLHREHVGRRVALAAASIAAGGAVLVLTGDSSAGGPQAVALGAVALATLAWAADNAIGRPLADVDPAAVVAAKCTLGAALSIVAALLARERVPQNQASIASLLACGAAGYGLSLRFYLLAQRRLGAGRAASVFAVAPFVGAAFAAALGEPIGGARFAVAAALMGFGAYLHVGEQHEHRHRHEPLAHDHAHTHDDLHHAHDHARNAAPAGAHSHPHVHAPLDHAHPHAPDLHHLHAHAHVRADDDDA